MLTNTPPELTANQGDRIAAALERIAADHERAADAAERAAEAAEQAGKAAAALALMLYGRIEDAVDLL